MHALKTVLLPAVMASFATAVPAEAGDRGAHEITAHAVPKAGDPCGQHTSIKYDCGKTLVCHVPGDKKISPSCTDPDACCSARRESFEVKKFPRGIVVMQPLPDRCPDADGVDRGYIKCNKKPPHKP